MDNGHRSPLVDIFRRGEAEREVRLLAARAELEARSDDQIAILSLLSDDPDPEIAAQAKVTLAAAQAAPPAPEPEPAAEPPAAEEAEQKVPISSLPIADRLKLAMKGTREQRGQLIRDSNRIVATAVLSSPKLTEAEVESFVKMGNVSEDVLRIIGTNRNWLKSYSVVLGLTRNPKTPYGMSMNLLHRLTEKDVKMLAVDRNVPESLRIAARRILSKGAK